jgi:hypothetical protein
MERNRHLGYDASVILNLRKQERQVQKMGLPFLVRKTYIAGAIDFNNLGNCAGTGAENEGYDTALGSKDYLGSQNLTVPQVLGCWASTEPLPS